MAGKICHLLQKILLATFLVNGNYRAFLCKYIILLILLATLLIYPATLMSVRALKNVHFVTGLNCHFLLLITAATLPEQKYPNG